MESFDPMDVKDSVAIYIGLNLAGKVGKPIKQKI